MTRTSPRPHRSGCPIASTLDLLGDRWSLVIVRDLLTGKSRFQQFLAAPERITTNILADRLAALEAAGLVEKAAYQERPPRYDYRLTEAGMGLLPVLQQVCRWANRFLPGTWIPAQSFMEWRLD